MTSSKEALHSHGEYTYVAELIESPRYADVEYSTRQQQYEQIVLCELLRGTGGELPDWAADPKRVPFISGTTVRTSLQNSATKQPFETRAHTRKCGDSFQLSKPSRIAKIMNSRQKLGTFSLNKVL